MYLFRTKMSKIFNFYLPGVLSGNCEPIFDGISVRTSYWGGEGGVVLVMGVLVYMLFFLFHSPSRSLGSVITIQAQRLICFFGSLKMRYMNSK